MQYKIVQCEFISREHWSVYHHRNKLVELTVSVCKVSVDAAELPGYIRDFDTIIIFIN